MANPQLWYVRRGEHVRGPFHAGLLRRYVLLGRLSPGDEASRDKVVWISIAQVTELMPPVMQDLDVEDPGALERLLAAKRWADERRGSERRASLHGAPEAPAGDDRRRGERRAPQPEADVKRQLDRSRRAARRRPFGPQRSGVLIAVSLATVFIALTVTGQRRTAPAPAECAAAPHPGVNWSYCRLEGLQAPQADLRGAMLGSADLSGADLTEAHLAGAGLAFAKLSLARLGGADLREARLTGANLKRADLRQADFSRADLTYADLRGADLTGADLAGAHLDNAIWIDGSPCARGSIGGCRQTVIKRGDAGARRPSVR